MKIEDLEINEQLLKYFLDKGLTELYLPQAEAVERGIMEGKNFVVAIPTASGKTLLAILAMFSSLYRHSGTKAVYLAPLRALAGEKYQELSEIAKVLGFKAGISTGDLDGTTAWLGKSDIIILTNEKFDSLIRHQVSWLNDISVIVSDEVHLINDYSRGPVLEVVLSLVRRNIPNCQIIALSATIENSNEIADWLNAQLVTSDWRPIKLQEGVWYNGEIFLSDGKIISGGKARDKTGYISLSEEIVEQGGQTLVFANTRKSAVTSAVNVSKKMKNLLKEDTIAKLAKIADEIRSVGEKTDLREQLANIIENGVAFHHAGLISAHRKIVEDSFRERLIKVIASTPSLAAGVNLPGRRVIIRSLSRYSKGFGSALIPVLEYKQMCFPHNTRISLSDGTEKQINDIQVGDKLFGFDESIKSVVEDVVIRIFSRKINEEFVKIETKIGTTLTGTSNHELLTQDGWKSLQNITENDFLVQAEKYNVLNKYQLHMLELLPENSTYIVEGGQLLKELKEKSGFSNIEIEKLTGLSRKSFSKYANNKKSIKFSVLRKIASEIGLDLNYFYDKISNVKSAYGNKFKINYISKDLMWLIGFIITDGNLQLRNDRRTDSIYKKIRIYNKRIILLDKCVIIFNKYGIEVTIKKDKRKEVHFIEFGNSLFADFFNKIGIPWNNKSDKIRLPEFFFKFPEDYKWSFLSGVFDGDGNFNQTITKKGKVQRILFSTASNDFAYQIQRLLIHCGILSYVSRKSNTKSIKIRGSLAHFKKDVYYVIFRKKKYIELFRKMGSFIKYSIPKMDVRCESTRDEIKGLDLIKIKQITKFKDSNEVFNLQTKRTNTYFASNLLVHNCGRAGRPQYDPWGQALVIAKNRNEVDEILERYVRSPSEDIYSQLGNERALRMHLLSFVASEYVDSIDSALEMFGDTFYGFQNEGDMEFLQNEVRKAAELLINAKLISKKEPYIVTPFGRKTVELYLDPLTADKIKVGLDKSKKEKDLVDILYLQLIASTPDMRSYSIRQKDFDILYDLASEYTEEWLDNPDDYTNEYSYDLFFTTLKTAYVIDLWLNEASENDIFEKMGVTSGDLQSMLGSTTWLIHSAIEISKLFDWEDHVNRLKLINKRLSYGISLELLPLVDISGIGRVRARALFDAGYKTIDSILSEDVEILGKVPSFGPRLAQNLKEAIKGGGALIIPKLKKKKDEVKQESLSSFFD